jgi:flagellar hook-associated protein 2
VAGVIATVENFNRMRAKLADLTAFDAELNTRGVLMGDSALLRVETDLSHLLSGRFLGVGSIQSLQAVGITLKDDGTLALDQARLQAKFAEDPAAVQEFFTKDEVGFSARLEQALEQMAGEESSLLGGRLESLTRKIDDNNERIGTMNDRLERQREQLLNEFVRLELAIAEIQSNLTFLEGIGPVTLPQNSRRSQTR